jgi:hypothetical protein
MNTFSLPKSLMFSLVNSVLIPGYHSDYNECFYEYLYEYIYICLLW